MEIPELADLIWLFEAEPTLEYHDLIWPVGLHSFRLRRDDREVLFSIDPASAEVYISLYVANQEIVSIGRLRGIESLAVAKRGGREYLDLRFTSERHDPLTLETKPEIKVSWNVAPLGLWPR